jgi:hypothetical protein
MFQNITSHCIRKAALPLRVVPVQNAIVGSSGGSSNVGSCIVITGIIHYYSKPLGVVLEKK